MRAWRPVPVERTALGPAAAASAPVVLQAVLSPAPDRERTVAHRVRRRLERAIAREGLDAYVVSLSYRTVTYKALVRAGQLDRFYPDLRDERCRGWFAIFHQRYSTNTSPGWERAQPFRMLCHNGEINTLAGNAARMRAREGGFGSGDPELEELLRPSIDERGSDSSMLDETVDLLTSHGPAGGVPRELPHAIAMTVPRAWERDPGLDDDARAFFRWHEARMEPWDGPAALVYTDGHVVGASLDRNGLRPLRYAATGDGLVVCASETGVVDLDGARVRLGRLGAGQMLIVDPMNGGLILDPFAELAGGRPFARWVAIERTRALGARGPTAAGRSRAEPGRTRAHARGRHARDPRDGLRRPRADLVHGRRHADAAARRTPAARDGVPAPALRPGHEPGPRPPPRALGDVAANAARTPAAAARRRAGGPGDDRARHVPVRARPGGDAARRHVGPGRGAGGAGAGARRARGEGRARGRIGRWRARGVARGDRAGTCPRSRRARRRRGAHGARRARPSPRDPDRRRDRRRVRSHDAACLLTCGADAVVPGLALATVTALHDEGRLPGSGSAEEARTRYRAALEEGVRKSMSRLGISVLDSYRGARAVDALGLAEEVVERCFRGRFGARRARLRRARRAASWSGTRPPSESGEPRSPTPGW